MSGAYFCAFRMMTQDSWDDIYQSVLQTTSPVHIIFFFVTIYLGTFYLINIILAIVAMSHDELQRQTEEENMR